MSLCVCVCVCVNNVAGLGNKEIPICTLKNKNKNKNIFKNVYIHFPNEFRLFGSVRECTSAKKDVQYLYCDLSTNDCCDCCVPIIQHGTVKIIIIFLLSSGESNEYIIL